MLAGQGSNTNIEVFIKLKNEGTLVYRPVPAIKIRENIYKLGGIDLYDPSDEEWEFLPGQFVVVEEKMLEGKYEFVAVGCG
jgi:hypothetical protein